MERSQAERLAPVRVVLLDLDGVLYVEEALVPGAREAVERLRSRGLELRFVTNTTSHSHPDTLRKLRRLGVPLTGSELITPAGLAVRHCLEKGWRRALLLMADEVKADFAQLEEDDERPDVVIVGDLGERFSYDVLNRAFRQLLAGARLVALQKNRYWMQADGLSLDVGPFVAALEYASGREAYVVGKPARGFFDEVLGGAGVRAGSAAMVGDDVESDIGGALRAGLAAILVRTGKYRTEAVEASGLEPTAVVDSIADVPGLFGA
ncbi:MAG TPA: TIGR01458 family HAD-type hydrolase [Thermoleophilaceae bacterium]|nr:TIGR01458 family HAD-type hydrolase [Thermoleophilaceae bacterium]